MEGRPEDIIPCISCNQGCFSRVFFYQPVWCLGNPRTGREYDPSYEIKPAQVKKKVVVIGGGPGGMEAAKIAATRCHDVTLYEKEPSLGGQMRLSSKTPFRGEIGNLRQHFVTQMDKLGVKVKLGTMVTPEMARQLGADVLIIATGSHSAMPEVTGIRQANVVPVDDVLDEKVSVGQNVVIWGGKLIGVQAAEFLQEKGKTVTIVEEFRRVGKDIVTTELMGFRRRLKEHNINTLTNARITRIEPKSVVVSAEGKEQIVAADTVVIALEREPNSELVTALQGAAKEVYAVGDCVVPRKMRGAIQEGFKVANQI